MKGLIFTEFIEMVEDKFGFAILDQIVSDANDPEEGAYTAVKTYDHHQLVNLVVALHKKTEIPLPALLQTYGEHLFGQLANGHKHLMEGITDSFHLLSNLEMLIHVEVRKLYPEAKTPNFTSETLSENTIRLVYESHRSMGDVAEGLIKGCANYFGDTFEIEKKALTEDGGKVEFTITKV